jgi:hypothetical protein
MGPNTYYLNSKTKSITIVKILGWLIVLIVTFNSFGFSNRTSYQYSCIGISSDGSVKIEIWNPKEGKSYDLETARKDAIHAMLFSGITSGENCSAMLPILNSKEEVDRFKGIEKKFFSKRGEYFRFATQIKEEAANSAPNKNIKVKSFKIVIFKENLRNYLMEAQIINSLRKGF